MGTTKNNQNKKMTKESIGAYCDWLADCEKSEKTIQKYRHYLEWFMKYTGGNSVEKECVLNWKKYLKSFLAPVTVNGALAALNGYFHYCRWDDCGVKFIKIGKNPFCQENRELSKDEYRKLVEAAMAKGNERLALLLQTVCACGIRISELPFITVEAVLKGRAEVESKGRVRTVVLTRPLCAMLTDYANRRQITQGSIFITRSGKAMNRSNIWREMKALSDDAKVDKDKIFPHNLRHLFARTYYKAEKSLAKLADILGHKDINTTRIYTMESGKQHRLQLERLGLLIIPYNRITLLL